MKVSSSYTSAEGIGLTAVHTAHGTGTQVGDAIEAEALCDVFSSRASDPLLLSSAKTVLGHCHGSATLVGKLHVHRITLYT